MRFFFINGVRRGEELPLAMPEITVGSMAGNTVVIDAPAVSARHAILRRIDDGSWTVEDRNSTTGIRINGEMMGRLAALKEGDILEFGDQQVRITGLADAAPKVVFEAEPAPPPAPGAEARDASDTGSDATPSSDEIPVDAKIRACREGLAETPDDPFLRLRLVRLFAQSGQASRATRHYNALVKRLASDRNVMPVHDAAAAMVEAAEHARATGDEAQALKFYRSAWKLNDPDLQLRITAAVSLLRLRGD